MGKRKKKTKEEKKILWLKRNIEVVKFKYRCSSQVKLIIGLLVIIGL